MHRFGSGSRRSSGGSFRSHRHHVPPTHARLRQGWTPNLSTLADLTFAQVSAEFPDDQSAHDWFVKMRWPNGVRCAFCNSDRVHDARAKRNRPIWKCEEQDCGKQFSVTSRTVMESTKLPLRKWLLGFYLISAHKKSVSAHQLHRDLGISLKAAWFMAHRIREAMDQSGEPLYGVVEADHTWLGGKVRGMHRGYTKNKIPVHGIASRSQSRGSNHYVGQTRLLALSKGAKPNQEMATEQLTDHVIPDESVLMTDETALYDEVGKRFVAHAKVNHSADGFVRGDAFTNTVEGVFAGLKRQIKGTHHSISEQHSQKYLDENAFKYNTREESDGERFVRAVRAGVGKRVRLFRPKRGKAKALRKRTVDGPAQEPWKRPRYWRGGSPLARRYGRRRALAKRAASLRDTLARIAERQAGEEGNE